MNTCPISLKYNEVLNRIRRVDRHSAASVPKWSPAAVVLTFDRFDNLLPSAGARWRRYCAAQWCIQGGLELLKQLK